MTNYIDKEIFEKTYALNEDRFINQRKTNALWKLSLGYTGMKVTSSTNGTVTIRGYVTPDERIKLESDINRILS